MAWTERDGGYWVISGYEEVAAAFRDWEHFSSARTDPEISSIVLGRRRLPLLTPEEIDPPDWYPLRRILSELLAPRAAERLRPRAHHWTTHFVDQFIEQGECEFTHDLSVPVPGAVTLEWLGFPETDWRMITDAFHDVAAHSRDTPEHRTAQAAVRQRDDAHQRGGRRTRALAPRRRDVARSPTTRSTVSGCHARPRSRSCS